MISSLLSTKLYLRRPHPDLVPRPRLIEQLNSGLSRKLTLISAPAGFGKTTLISSWADQMKRPIAWISLDQEDNDLGQFLSYLIAALQMANSSIGQRAQAALQSQQALLEKPILMTLVNEIAELSPSGSESPDNDLVLVLDDYHVIVEPAVHQAITFLLESPLPGLRLVLLSRIDPPLPLSKLRAHNQIVEIRGGDLEFSVEEIDAFLNETMNLVLEPEDIRLLEARTEGWIAGLQLAAISLQNQTNRQEFIQEFSGNDRYVIDYLLDEVLLRQPRDVRQFLLQTSILDRMCGSLCDAVVNLVDAGAALNGQEFLEHLDQMNLFIVPLDSYRKWYRYHHLFSEVLLHRLQQNALDQIPELHLKASEWYEGEGHLDQAIHHALAANNLERAVQLVEQNSLKLLTDSNLTTLAKRLKALPKELVQTRPFLCVFQAWMHLLAGRIEEAKQWLQKAERLLAPATQDEEPVDREIYGHISMIRAHIALKNRELAKAVELAHQTMDDTLERSPLRGHVAVIEGLAAFWSDDLEAANQALSEAISIALDCDHMFMAVDASIWLGYIKTLQGRLHEAGNFYRDAIQLADLGGKRILPIAGCAYIGLALLEREWNNLATAEDLLRDGLELCNLFGTSRIWHLALARVRQAQGDLGKALEEIQKADEERSNPDVAFSHLRTDHERVRLWLSHSGRNLPAAIRWAEDSGINTEDAPSFSQWIASTLLARVLIVEGEISKASGLLNRLRNDAVAHGRNGDLIEILALLALIHETQGDTTQAEASLKRALVLAEEEGYVQTFVDLGAPLARLLRKVALESSEYALKLIQAIDLKSLPNQSESASVSPEQLSARELQVLRLLKTDLSGPEIAREMVVELSTFRFHTKNIYRKLMVNNRRAAVGRAEDFGLI